MGLKVKYRSYGEITPVNPVHRGKKNKLRLNLKNLTDEQWNWAREEVDKMIRAVSEVQPLNTESQSRLIPVTYEDYVFYKK